MSVSEVAHVFECLGLTTQEQRNDILSQGKLSIFEQSSQEVHKTWISNGTEDELERGGINARLEDNS